MECAPNSLNCLKTSRGEALRSSHQSKQSTRRRMGGRTQRRIKSDPWKKTIALVLTFYLFLPILGEFYPFKWDENIWVYLAKNVLNIPDFCLSGGTYVEQTFTSCLVGVGTPIRNIKNYTHFITFDKTITYDDIYSLGPSTRLKDKDMFSLKVAAVAPVGECVYFSDCSKSCFRLSTDHDMNCTSNFSMIYAYGHVKLPGGWFLICGLTVYSYIPANSTGGPCSLGRLTIFMSQRHLSIRARRDLSASLSPDFSDSAQLWGPAKYISLATFVMPVMATSLNREMSRQAYSTVKALTATSRAISAINRGELEQIKEAILENRAGLDYFLQRHNQGCEECKGLCCFNWTDKSQLIVNKQQVNDTIPKVKQEEGFFGVDILTSWLPRLAGIRELFLLFLFLVFCSLTSRCCVQRPPHLKSRIRRLPSPCTSAKPETMHYNGHMLSV